MTPALSLLFGFLLGVLTAVFIGWRSEEEIFNGQHIDRIMAEKFGTSVNEKGKIK